MPEATEPLSTETLQALADVGEGLGNGVVVVCGFPASGKSSSARYLAQHLAAVLLDKDGFAPGLEEAVMQELTGNPHDRDSALYRRVVGPNIYDALTRNALHFGRYARVVVDAPYLEYVTAAAAAGVSLSEYIRAKSEVDVPVRTVWVAADADTIKQRMISRGAERDLPKLEDWATYQRTVLDSGVALEAKAAVDHVVFN
ncbi:AAA family ATPase [Nocardia testacea]|uniref:AAA family ATPase n=1 Tax=Nocardia testacea TaxID=248551 RepID=UPI003C2D17C2